ncbi:ER membrane protein complex subunit 3 [Nymphaea thermarum]|nr:ER membrane protein complex subunit 3 [Nymphaea thermarum]
MKRRRGKEQRGGGSLSPPKIQQNDAVVGGVSLSFGTNGRGQLLVGSPVVERGSIDRSVYLSAGEGAMAEDLVLDTAIRDWVLIPLSVVMVLIGVLRHFVSKLLRSSQPPDVKMLKEGQVILRARNLKAAANFIPASSFRSRKAYFTNEENGLLFVPKGQAQNAQAQMFSDPNMAMDMMKKNLSMIIPQTLTFAWVNFFFSGFVAAKIPFPLTQRFRGMLQNGIDLSTVDVSYVSSRSWYFLNLFGLRGLFSLILGEENAMDDAQRMMQMSGGFGFDPTRSLSAEKDSLDIVQHEWVLPQMEQRAEAVLRKIVGS